MRAGFAAVNAHAHPNVLTNRPHNQHNRSLIIQARRLRVVSAARHRRIVLQKIQHQHQQHHHAAQNQPDETPAKTFAARADWVAQSTVGNTLRPQLISRVRLAVLILQAALRLVFHIMQAWVVAFALRHSLHHLFAGHIGLKAVLLGVHLIVRFNVSQNGGWIHPQKTGVSIRKANGVNPSRHLSQIAVFQKLQIKLPHLGGLLHLGVGVTQGLPGYSHQFAIFL